MEPRTQHDYGSREIEAARRVLIDLGQVLGSFFRDSVVVVGGWVPDLLILEAEERHIGSIDVDLALDAEKLRDGRYADILSALVATRRYATTDKQFRLRATVDLGDGESAMVVDVDFLKPLERRRKRKGPALAPGFRPLDADGCAAAFRDPARVKLEGRTISGAANSVQVRVASIADFLVMKAYALAGRDKPKDAYDICYCLDHVPDGIESLARPWRESREDALTAGAIAHLQEKFASVDAYGPQQVASFYDASTTEERDRRARRAYELVARFLEIVHE